VNFFDAQDRARRATRWLVVVYIVATILIVLGVTAIVTAALFMGGETNTIPPASLIVGTATLATLLIVGATLYKTARLSAGGGRVALDMGGTLISPDVQDPLRRRLRNVVEEMAIASGVPVPEIYVLEEENGINAFAAGFAPGDAAVAVTRGCLELLDRNELQGVIAHEFSHILNGDMRLNIRMMGVLFGIMVLGIIGRFILRGSYYGSMSSRKGKGAPVILIVGLGLAILGWIGVFFARTVKASVSRQREFLADASAVQFTRQTDGLANALKKIGGYSDKSYIKKVDPEEVSHMLFAGGVARLTSLFATHPPLIERIHALDPGFDESEYPDVNLRTRDRVARSEAVAGFSPEASAALSGIQSTDIVDTVVEAIGRPEHRHVTFAQNLRTSIPATLYAAAHSPDDSLLLAIALSLAGSESESAQQLRVVEDQIGQERADKIRQLHALIQEAGPGYRLPLLEIAFPMLKKRPTAQIEFLLEMIDRLVRLDGRVDLSEFCFYRILQSHLLQASQPAGKPGNRVSKDVARRAAVNLIRLVADHGHTDPEEKRRAFDAGVALFGGWAEEHDSGPGGSDAVEMLDQSLAALRRMNSAGRQSLVRAVSKTIAYDGQLTLAEAELLRTICATLDCPMPPVLADNPTVIST
jgi:Zn-dependent protease with chaperone function